MKGIILQKSSTGYYMYSQIQLLLGYLIQNSITIWQQGGISPSKVVGGDPYSYIAPTTAGPYCIGPRWDSAHICGPLSSWWQCHVQASTTMHFLRSRSLMAVSV